MTTNSSNPTYSPAGYSRGADGAHHAAGRLVVDTGDLSIIDELLPGAGHVVDEIDELGLSLLAFDDIDAAIADLPEPTGRYASPRGADPVEELMARIRSAGSRLQPARVPEMGKNRVVLGGEGLPYVSPKDPTLTAQAASGPFPDPVNATQSARADGTSSAALDEGTVGVEEESAVARNAQDDGAAVIVGILDTSVVVPDAGFAPTVSALDRMWELAPDDLKQAWQGHGTFVTGLVRAKAPQARIRVRAVLVANEFATAWEAAKGMVELKNARVHVINMSIGCVTGDNQPPFALRRAVDKLRDVVVLVAAAGNRDPKAEGRTARVWPAALPGVLAVGSITEQGVPSAFSPQERWVDLAAVGEDVRSTFTTGDVVCRLDGGGKRKRHFWGTAIWSGTSFAAATVTGRLAELACETLARRRAPGEDVNPVEIIRDVAEKLASGELADDVVRQP